MSDSQDPRQIVAEARQAAALATLQKAQEGIGSRFETQTSINEANERREKEWRDAYARIGQEPPKREEEPHDGRTLYEKLAQNKNVKQEEWDEKMKLSNQYRGLDAEEHRFLADRAAAARERERKIKEDEQRELLSYREALSAKQAGQEETPRAAQPKKQIPVKPVKKDMKSLVKGLVVKKPKPAAATGAASAAPPRPATSGHVQAAPSGSIQSALKAPEKRPADDDLADEEKRPRTDSS